MTDGCIEDLSDTLCKAALYGNKDMLESLLQSGSDPNVSNAKGNGPLHEAAHHGETECASLLLAHKASVNARGFEGKTPLHMAASGVCIQTSDVSSRSEFLIQENQKDIVRLLVAHGADLTIQDKDGNTARDLAIYCDFYDCADLIDELQKLQMKQLEDQRQSEKIKEMHAACAAGDLDKVKEVLPQVRESLNQFFGIKKENLLMCAADLGHIPIVGYCLSEGAVAVANPLTNRTALHMACENGHEDVVVALLNRLPALLMIDDSAGETSLHIVARKGHASIMKNFLRIAKQTEVLKSPSCSRLEEEEMSQVEPAYLYDSKDTAHVMNEALPEIEVDVMAKCGSDQRTPLHEAAISGHADIVQLLVDFLQENNQSPRLGKSATSSSFAGGSGGRSAHQSNLDDPDFKRHALHANGGSSGTMSKQGGSGGNVPGIDLSTLKGRTAFHEASRHGHYEVMKILLKAGADINAFMNIDLDRSLNTDLTALVQACLMNQVDTVRFLLRHGAKDARLKALSRSLKGSLHDVAGVLLCYNNHLREVSLEVRKALGLSLDPKLSYLQVTWSSHNLKFICADWLDLAIMEFPKPKGHYCAITQLDLSTNQITELPKEIFKLQSLVNLDISRNQVDFLPHNEEKFNGGWKCSKLSCFECVKNNLTSLPPCLFRLTELREVNACSNKISFIPPNVWTAPKLKRLYLSSNCLETFPSPNQMVESDEVALNLSDSPAHTESSLASLGESAISDSGYKSDMHGSSFSQMDTKSTESSRRVSVPDRKMSLRSDSSSSCAFLIPRGPKNALSKLQIMDRVPSQSIQTQAVISRRLESFQDGNTQEEELEELHEASLEEKEDDIFPLEILDISSNQLSVIPPDLSCLTPKLTKLNVSKNKIKSLGHINDYPIDLEFLDASNNLLHTAIAPALSFADRRYNIPYCARKVMSMPLSGQASDPQLSSLSSVSMEAMSVGTPSSPNYLSKVCSHRLHKNLRKLSTLKLNHNKLIDLQLFRMMARSNRLNTDLGSSYEEASKSRAQTTSDPFAVVINTQQQKQDNLSKSVGSVLYTRTSNLISSKRLQDPSVVPVFTNGTYQQDGMGGGSGGGGRKSSGSSPGSGSQEDSDGLGSPSTPVSVVISPFYPTLATLELVNNNLKSVPSNVHHISSLSCLLLSHNPDIDTLPLELSNLEHLWNLEYEGCPLTNPPKQDLDKFRLASDKLLYMRSLLHDAKPNESMKLMLVGYQKMGKTTLLSRLREVHEKVTPFTTFTQRITGEEPAKPKKGRIDTLSTVGVDVGIWKYRKDLEGEQQRMKKKGGKTMRSVTFYTWDFGGQEEYYVTHQCFLSTRSLYLVVWSVMEGVEGIDRLGLWLHNIQARAPSSPVVIVGTHCDSLKPEAEKERRKTELNNIIYQKYLVGHGPQQLREMGLPKILDVIYVGCPLNGKAEGVADLRVAIYDIAFSLPANEKGNTKAKLLDQPIPANFLKMEEAVRHLAVSCRHESESPVLKEQLFRERTKGIIANPRELNQAVTFLHENGVMLHYATPALSHLYFVDPQWLCDMLAHIVTVPEVNRFIPRQDSPEAGILRTTVLSHVFKGNVFPQAHRKEYIELLGKFEVALYLDKHRLLVPSMLPPRPAFTVHRFKNVFPRPPVHFILQMVGDTLPSANHASSSFPVSPQSVAQSSFYGSSSISSSLSSSSTTNSTPGKSGDLSYNRHLPCSSSAVGGDTLGSPDWSSPILSPYASSTDIRRTGLLLRRFYFMTYVPSGFWARLISRFLASSEFIAIILRNLGFDSDRVSELAKDLVSGVADVGKLDLEWAYWKSGIELWYKDVSLMRLSEIIPEGSFHGCKAGPPKFSRSSRYPIDPSVDTKDLTFELNGSWVPVDLNPNRGIEVLVPDAVNVNKLLNDLQELQAATPASHTMAGGGGQDQDEDVPVHESHWMSAELLSFAVNFIDTLLEDWYPGLGSREGSRTMDSIPYVNRVIPCPFCINKAIPVEDYMAEIEKAEAAAAAAKSENSSSLSLSSGSSMKKSFRIGRRKNKQANQTQEGSGGGPSPKAKRSLFHSSSNKKQQQKDEEVVPLAGSPLSPREAKGGIGAEELLEEEEEERPTRRTGTLLEWQGKLDYPVKEPRKMDASLMAVSRFGFMIEQCIVAARHSQPLICPSHSNHPLRIRDVAPDLVFADLPSSYLLNPECVDKGQYIDHGSFGDIYRGAVYPSVNATDDEGREVAIKIDRVDSKKFSPETATKSYVEVRAEVAILHRLQHPYVIDFIGVVLQPLCFILEWAPGGSLHSILQKYRKLDARISPEALKKTAYQVASGLAYLHEQNIVYYDLKSPNILVFQFPCADDSLLATQGQGFTDQCATPSPKNVAHPASNVYVKIADLGISQILSPGGVMGFKGSPGFMAPEILKYVGTEACTEKVDIYSFAMFLFETISLHFPFEKQNLMHAQIEKLVIEGERPPLQSRELNNPMLYLDIMRWCWQQDFRNRPSAAQLRDVLTNPSIPYLLDAMPLHNTGLVTCACICTLPYEVMPLSDSDSSVEGSLSSSSFSSLPSPHAHVARGDLQEELWLATFCERDKIASIVVLSFKGKAVQSFPVCASRITAMCGVNCSMWLGTSCGEVFIVDVFSKHKLYNRYLAVHSEQSIVGLYHIVSLRRVVVVRSDGYLVMCKEDIENRHLADVSNFDNRQNQTALPVVAATRFPETLPVLCSTAVSVTLSGTTKWSIWCGTENEMVVSLELSENFISNAQKLYNRSRYEVDKTDRVTSIVTTEAQGAPGVSVTHVWAFTSPANVLYCWDTVRENVMSKINLAEYCPDQILFFSVTDTRLLFAAETGKVFRLSTDGSKVVSCVELRGHIKDVCSILSLGARTLPRHWLPSIIGRNNVVNYYRDLVDEKEAMNITATMVGRQTRLVVSVGRGYRGVAERLVEPLMSPRDSEEMFLLLWSLDC